jgi:hypothetical protein
MAILLIQLLVVAFLASPSNRQVAGNTLTAGPGQTISVGRIVKIVGNEITIAALNDPHFTKSFSIAAETRIFHRNREIPKQLLEPEWIISLLEIQENGIVAPKRVDIIKGPK